MSNIYLPLQVCKNFTVPAERSNNQLMKTIQDIIEDRKSDELLLYICSDKFMDAGYKGEFVEFNRVCLKYWKRIIHDLTGIEPESLKSEPERKNLIIDLVIPNFIITEWSKSKQVYCFDAEMENALMNTEKVKISPVVFRRLPYRCFYIEFAEGGYFTGNGGLEDNHGVFVKFSELENGDFHLIFIRFRNDQKYFTGHLLLDHRSYPDIPVQDREYIIDRELDCPAESVAQKDWKQFAMFVLNAILYLCAVNNEVTENPVTAKTYHPGRIAKNKFSEVRKWDVGVRFGAAVRCQKDRIQKDAETDCPESNSHKSHASPRPYMRRAHWHHYWTGKGRTELILKWIEPVFVGSGDLSAVKHRVE